MGKFNWRGAAQGALGSIYNDLQQNQDQKRAYERQDREMAAQLYAKMLESGVDPASLNMDAAGLGKYMQDALKQYGPAMAEADRKKAEQEIADWESKYEKQKQMDLYYSPTMNKPTPPTEEVRNVSDFSGFTPEEFLKLSNSQKRSLRIQYYKDKRKNEGEGVGSGGAKGTKARYTIRTDPTTGAIYKFNVDTNEETLVKPETEQHRKNRESKEKAQVEQDRLKREKEARGIFDKFATAPSDDRLSYYNDWLKMYGKTIKKIPKTGFFGGSTYELAPLGEPQETGNPQDPLGINQ
jgi:hypothetical protein